jgi:hypothetical protein
MTTGTPGRLGITITGPLSARTGAGAKAKLASATATKAVRPRDMKAIRFIRGHFRRSVPQIG